VNRTAPPPLTPRTKGPDLRIRHGLAEQLARLSHFATLGLPESHEMDEVACWLIRPVENAAAVWRDILPVCEHLHRLITEDWDDDDLDPCREDDPVLAVHAVAARHARTVERLTCEIENTVGFARLRHAEIRRAS
jgi:hypothetical protein